MYWDCGCRIQDKERSCKWHKCDIPHWRGKGWGYWTKLLDPEWLALANSWKARQ